MFPEQGHGNQMGCWGRGRAAGMGQMCLTVLCAQGDLTEHAERHRLGRSGPACRRCVCHSTSRLVLTSPWTQHSEALASGHRPGRDSRVGLCVAQASAGRRVAGPGPGLPCGVRGPSCSSASQPRSSRLPGAGWPGRPHRSGPCRSGVPPCASSPRRSRPGQKSWATGSSAGAKVVSPWVTGPPRLRKRGDSHRKT